MDRLAEGVTRFADLARDGLAAGRAVDAGLPPRGVVLVGMGGSGAAAAALCPWVSAPCILVSAEAPPAGDLAGWLVVATSYSGRTRETLVATRAAIEQGARCVTIGTGGPLASLGHAHVPVHEGFPPRGALGALLGATAGVLEAAGVLDPDIVDDGLEGLAAVVPDDDATAPLAQGLSAPVLVLAHAPYQAAAARLAAELAENAKLAAVAQALPEACHNLIVPLGLEGWSGTVILLEAAADRAAALRVQAVRDELRGQGADVRTLSSKRDGLGAMLDLILMGDALSLAVARHRGVDPYVITPIDSLKERLHGEGL